MWSGCGHDYKFDTLVVDQISSGVIDSIDAVGHTWKDRHSCSTCIAKSRVRGSTEGERVLNIAGEAKNEHLQVASRSIMVRIKQRAAGYLGTICLIYFKGLLAHEMTVIPSWQTEDSMLMHFFEFCLGSQQRGVALYDIV